MTVRRTNPVPEFRPFTVYCIVHHELEVTSLEDVHTESATNANLGAGYTRIYVKCPYCPEGSEMAKKTVDGDAERMLKEILGV